MQLGFPTIYLSSFSDLAYPPHDARLEEYGA